jgi:hypothetical protein
MSSVLFREKTYNLDSSVVIANNTIDCIISFGGMAKQFGATPPFEFLNFLEKHFYVDDKLNCYHNGINGISTDIEGTVVYFSDMLKKYNNVIMIGYSGGGYAVILFGSLLNITTVIAFMPVTKLITAGKVDKYRNLNTFINTVTKYHLFGNMSVTDERDVHHLKHCNNILGIKNTNVLLTKLENIIIKNMRDTGELLKIFNSIIQ